MTDLCNHHLCLSCSTFRNFRFCIALLHRCSSCESYSLICVTITTTLYWYFDFRWLKDNTAVLKYIVRRHKMSFLPLFPHHVFHMWLFYRKPTIIWPFCVRLWHISSYFQLFAIITTDYIHKKKHFAKKPLKQKYQSYETLKLPSNGTKFHKLSAAPYGDTSYYNTHSNTLTCLKCGHHSNHCPQYTSSLQWGFKQKGCVFLGRRGCFSPACGSCGSPELHRKSYQHFMPIVAWLRCGHVREVRGLSIGSTGSSCDWKRRKMDCFPYLVFT